MNIDLSGQVALVTGGGSGIGEAVVHELAASGASVVVADISEPSALRVAAAVNGDALGVRADVTQEDDVSAMIETVVRRFGHLDVAVNNAGIGMPVKAAVGDTPTQVWRQVMNVNADGAFLCMRAELEVMTADRGGSIVNVASVMGAVAAEGASPYVASKHALVGLTKAAALDYSSSGIRVNAVGAGFVDTPLLAGRNPEWLAKVAASHPLRRLGRAEEIASVIVFLASPAASFVTGAYIPVDGGYLAQ